VRHGCPHHPLCIGRNRLTELTVIRHEPDDGFLECARAANAELIVTVNTAPDQFDRKQYLWVNVARPGEFLNMPEGGGLVKRVTARRSGD
jgi:predicted nucleic acid-binding protein